MRNERLVNLTVDNFSRGRRGEGYVENLSRRTRWYRCKIETKKNIVFKCFLIRKSKCVRNFFGNFFRPHFLAEKGTVLARETDQTTCPISQFTQKILSWRTTSCNEFAWRLNTVLFYPSRFVIHFLRIPHAIFTFFPHSRNSLFIINKALAEQVRPFVLS